MSKQAIETESPRCRIICAAAKPADPEAPLFIATRPLAEGELIELELTPDGLRLVELEP